MTTMMMKTLAAVALVASLAACKKSEVAGAMDTTAAAAAPAAAGVNPTMAIAAAAISKSIDAMPGKADSILAANNTTAVAFESLLYSIAADSASAAAYAAAMK